MDIGLSIAGLMLMSVLILAGGLFDSRCRAVRTAASFEIWREKSRMYYLRRRGFRRYLPNQPLGVR
jgi:hypothetical protein